MSKSLAQHAFLYVFPTQQQQVYNSQAAISFRYVHRFVQVKTPPTPEGEGEEEGEEEVAGAVGGASSSSKKKKKKKKKKAAAAAGEADAIAGGDRGGRLCTGVA